MKKILTIVVIAVCFTSCKNNGSGTTQSTVKNAETSKAVNTKDIIVGAKRKPVEPDFQVLNMAIKNDALEVVFQYSGGCQEHDFNAHFNGGWLKSLPPQAVLDFEHLNPNNDACRSIVKDTALYKLDAIKYPSANEVVIKTTANKKLFVSYKY
jgi:hypothetical protein